MAETKTPKRPTRGARTANPARSRTTRATNTGKPVEAKAAGPAKAPGTATKRPSKKDSLAAELRVEVAGLRSSLDETVEQFRIRLGGQLAKLESVLEGADLAGTAPVKPDVKAATTMLKDIRSLKVKPKKGRTKDLVRLADLVEDLLDLLPPQP